VSKGKEGIGFGFDREVIRCLVGGKTKRIGMAAQTVASFEKNCLRFDHTVRKKYRGDPETKERSTGTDVRKERDHLLWRRYLKGENELPALG